MRKNSRGLPFRRWVGLLLVCGWATGAPVWALSVRKMSMDEVTDKSEHIFTATCEAKRTEFRNGNIMTIYTLRPKDVWKGHLQTKGDGTLEMEDLGGAMGDKIRINQHVDGATSMVAGEQVLLFTQSYKPNPELEKQGKPGFYKTGNLQVTGRVYGRFSVLKHPTTGQEHIVRPGLEGQGVIPNDQSMRAYLDAQQKALKNQPAQGAGGSQAAGSPSKGGAHQPLSGVLRGVKAERGLSQKMDKADAAGQGRDQLDVNGSLGDIRNYEKLSDVKARVVARVKNQESKQGKGGKTDEH